jgi:DNA-binding CsgD family transcriptional regulator
MTRFDLNGEQRELLVAEIYRSVLGAAPIRHALRELAVQTGSDKAIWSTCDLERNEAHIVDSHNVAPEFAGKFSSLPASQDVWLSKAQYYQAEGLIWRGSRIVPPSELITTPFFFEILAPQQIYHTLHIVVMAGARHVIRVLLSRPQQEPDFGGKEIDTARCFAFHARQALESQRALAEQAVIRSGLDEVIYTTPVCDRILASLGSPSGNKTGGSRSPGNVVHFPRPVADAINTHHNGGVKRLIVSDPDEERHILVNIKAIAYRGPSQFEKRLLVVSFFDFGQKVPVDQELLQSAYDLTSSEIRICALLANNESVESVSGKLGISPNTARTHIKRIFSKTGAARQAELVKLMMNTATLHRNETNRAGPDETEDGDSSDR